MSDVGAIRFSPAWPATRVWRAPEGSGLVNTHPPPTGDGRECNRADASDAEREALRAERDRYRSALVNVIAAHDARIERPRGWMTRYDAAIDAARAALATQS